MTQMTLEPNLRSRLGQADSEVELRDEQGQVVGYFVPPPLHRGGETRRNKGEKQRWGETKVSATVLKLVNS